MLQRRTALKFGIAAPFIARGAGQTADVVVYGATPAGVIAALAATGQGMSVALIEPRRHAGGMVTGGLGKTDKANTAVIGGMSLDFFRKVGRRYRESVSWDFEPHVASNVFAEWLREARVTPVMGAELKDVRKTGNRIEAIRTQDDRIWTGKVFIDAGYEGDLMAAGGVKYIVGREGQQQYGETLAGRLEFSIWDQFWMPVDPYDSQGKLLPLVYSGDGGKPGEADGKTQAYNYRLCLSSDRSNQVPITKPPHYEPGRWQLLSRYLAKAGKTLMLNNLIMLAKIPNGKLDVNNNGPISTDYLGASWQYPDATWAKRREIWDDHLRYTQEFLYFIGNDASVPVHLREEMQTWGLAKDEFAEHQHWPPQLYVREGRRMTGEAVMTQADLQTTVSKPDSIGMGSYNIDSHHIQRIPSPVGAVVNEGFIVDRRVKPYHIPYRSIIPKLQQCSNLLAPVCCSASHVAYSSIRMEPQYMILGHAAGVAAALAAKRNVPVQRIDIAQLQQTLRSQGQIMDLPGAPKG